MHKMSFYWSTDVGEYLFAGLNINGLIPLLLLCLVVLLMTISYEGMKVLQTKAKARTARERTGIPQPCPGSETTNLLISADQQQNTAQPSEIKSSRKLLLIMSQAIIFSFHTTLGNILMLTAMVYNGYVFLVIIFGMGLGYFLFGHISMKTNMENIRARTTQNLCPPTLPGQPSTSQSNAIRSKTSNDCQSSYINELVETSSSNSSRSSTNFDNSCYTEKSTLEIHDTNSLEDNEAVIQTCRL